MPVWHAATRRWVREGRLAVVGVVQEQHADRARLFAQWHRLDWPILHDPINLLDLNGVPVLVALDEQGIVRAVNPALETFERDFLDRSFGGAPVEAPPRPAPRPSLALLRRQAEGSDTAAAWRALGDGLVLWGGPKRVGDAIAAYRRALERNAHDGATLFRMGVCFRARYDSPLRQPGDFQQAAEFWGRALGVDPNVYIWRRRIQQYGPRLTKPYAFYDWVEQARRDIAARGETPVALGAEPCGAEIAHPTREMGETDPGQQPDPQARVQRDTEGLVHVEAAVVPARVRPGEAARVHLALTPDPKRRAHWNNESEPLRIWLEAPVGWRLSQHLLVAPQGERPQTDEVRSLDLEVLAPGDAKPGAALRGYALYYVCEGAGGRCLYLRQDLEVALPLAR